MSKRAESRTIRPFRGLATISELFERTTIRVDSKVFTPGPVILEEEGFLKQKFILSLGFGVDELQQAIEESGIPDVDTALVLISRGKTLRTTNIQFVHLFRNLNLPESVEIEVDNDPLIFRDRAGFVTTFALVLFRTLQHEPLRPWIAGTWLGQAKFSVSIQSDISSITPQKLTSEIREEFSLGAESLSFVDISPDVLDVDSLSEAVTLYLDEDVLSLIQSDKSGKYTQHIQAQLICELIFQLILKISKTTIEIHGENASLHALQEVSVARVFLERITEKLVLERDSLISMAIGEPARLFSRIQSEILDMKSVVLEDLKES